MSISERNAKERLEFLEYVDYLAQISPKVVIQIGSDAAGRWDANSMAVWLDDLQERGLIKDLRTPPPAPSISKENVGKLIRFTVKDGLHDYIDEAYRYWNLSIENLSKKNFMAVFDLAYDMRQKYEVTQSATVEVVAKANVERFPELNEKYMDWRANAIQFLKEYGTLKNVTGNRFYYEVTVERRYFDRTYQRIMTRALQDGLVKYAKDPAATKALAEESKRRQAAAAEKEHTKTDEAISDQDGLILFLAVIAKAFTDGSQEPASLPLGAFEPLSFEQVEGYVDRLSGDKTFIVRSRPQSAQDSSPYELEQTEHQKAEYAKTKSEMGHLRDMQMLMIYWGRICTVYDAMAGRYGNFEDGQLNRLYLLLVIRVDKILAKDGFEEQRKAKPQLYDTFMGNLEDLDMAYEFMRPDIWNYYGTLERQFVEKADGVGSFELTDEEQKLINDTDKAAKEHSKILARWEAANFGAPTMPEDKAEPQKPTPKAETAKTPGAEAKPTPKKIDLHKLLPDYYKNRTGTLYLAPGYGVAIAKRGKVKRPDGKKYDQCWLLECLFKTVNTLKSGIKVSTVLRVSDTKIGKKEVKKIRNIVDEINQKVAGAGGLLRPSMTKLQMNLRLGSRS